MQTHAYRFMMFTVLPLCTLAVLPSCTFAMLPSYKTKNKFCQIQKNLHSQGRSTLQGQSAVYVYLHSQGRSTLVAQCQNGRTSAAIPFSCLRIEYSLMLFRDMRVRHALNVPLNGQTFQPLNPYKTLNLGKIFHVI